MTTDNFSAKGQPHDYTQSIHPHHLGGCTLAWTVARAVQAEGEAPAATLGGLPTNLLYTAEAPGVWKTKVDSHAPEVSVADGKLTMKTKHSMNEEHYIVRHTLVSGAGEVLGGDHLLPHRQAGIRLRATRRVRRQALRHQLLQQARLLGRRSL